MTQVNIICVGKLKEKYLKDACAEYEKRLGAFCKINVVEVSEFRVCDDPTNNEIKLALENEGNRILSFIKPRSYTFSMCIEGKDMTSLSLAEKLKELSLNGISVINFVIGSSYGLSQTVKEKSDHKLSMSKMTFPHQLARVMLLEQIYRAYTIINNKKYHK